MTFLKGRKTLTTGWVREASRQLAQLPVYTFQIGPSCQSSGQKLSSVTVNLPPCVVEIMWLWLLAETIFSSGHTPHWTGDYCQTLLPLPGNFLHMHTYKNIAHHTHARVHACMHTHTRKTCIPAHTVHLEHKATDVSPTGLREQRRGIESIWW